MSANNPYQQYPYQVNYGGAPSYAPRSYNYQQQPQTQPQMQIPMAQQMQPQIPVAPQVPQIQDVRHGTEDEIKAHIVYPNFVSYFIDYPKNRLYAKYADASGISNIAYFSITHINADGSPMKPQEPTPQVNFDEFVKIDQIKDMGFVTVAQYNELAQKLEQMQKQMEGVRQNVGKPKQSN